MISKLRWPLLMIVFAAAVFFTGYFLFSVFMDVTDKKKYLPEQVHVGKTLYSSGLDEAFEIYQLDPTTAAALDREGVDYLNKAGAPHAREGAHRYVLWRRTPMFETNGLSADALADARRNGGPDSENVSLAVMQARQASPAASKLIAEARSAANRPGNYFTLDVSLECGILIDREDSIVLLACHDR